MTSDLDIGLVVVCDYDMLPNTELCFLEKNPSEQAGSLLYSGASSDKSRRHEIADGDSFGGFHHLITNYCQKFKIFQSM